MNDLPGWFLLIVILCGAAFDVSSNVLLKKSSGFTDKKYGISAILLMLLAMTCLVIAIKGLPLAVAYAIWTSAGVLGTALLGWRLFGQKLRLPAWIGMAMLVYGIVLLYKG